MQRIQTEEDVLAWKQSPGYRAFFTWIERRAERIVGKEIVEGNAAEEGCSERIRKILLLLKTMEQWSDEVELYPETQRFGNRAFRKYIALVEERLPSALPTPPEVTDQILPLLLQSHAFGHPVRLDYGSGHELSFVLALFTMVQMEYFGRGEEGEKEEDDLVLRVFPRYLSLVTGLQKKYRLEPAGSHGVWGLDDYCFLPYVWGSAQLLGSDITPQQALENARRAAKEPGSAIVKDLWTISLRRIFEFKTGPFFEHSPLLNSLSTTMPNFRKIHRGLLKMYAEEVLGKRVVVQHLFLSEITWGPDIAVGARKEGTSDPVGKVEAEATKAPWAK
ncbi:Serine/threonine-protein phosphatase 2A activator 1 [Naganishia albida]|nr:Serine/threonine-protein phosphatase 2A activator 1 [Naganishia albida]